MLLLLASAPGLGQRVHALSAGMQPVSAALAEEMLLTLLAGVLIILFLARNGILWAGIATAILIGACQVPAWERLNTLAPSFALVGIFAAGLAAAARERTKRRALVARTFAETLPRPVFDRLVREPELLKLDGETRTVTYLSGGVRDFSALAAVFVDAPYDFTKLMRLVAGKMLDAAVRHGGTLDRVSSDGLSVFWNAPLDDAQHVAHACEAALAIGRALAEAKAEIAATHLVDPTLLDRIEIGTGLASGAAVAGQFGAREHAVYSVSGEPVARADGAKTASQRYGFAIVADAATAKDVGDTFALLEIDTTPSGKVYALLGNAGVRVSPKFRALSTFHTHIFAMIGAREWSKARALIVQCRKLSGASQPLYDLYLDRLDVLENALPADWDGTLNAERL
ncbi:MAG TPA: adenylate/guanylate cyclase domain-containing protein [Rhizomicrobium sp.]|jgi:adenylate cyclase